jgi:hypothetical protein
MGGTLEISGANCRFPDVAYGAVSRQYLVVWPDYGAANGIRVFGRFVRGDGSMPTGVFPISENGFGALYPAIAFNSASNEFLVTWDDAGGRGGVIYGQRVRGSDGALMGTNFPIGSIYGGIRSAVAWSPASASYLVVFWGPGAVAPEVYGQRVSGNGSLLGTNFNISTDGIFSGYPAIAWAAPGDQFLVTWDNEDGNIYGRRISAANGAPLSATIFVTAGGAKDRSCVVYDPANGRWMVQFNNNANPGFSYDQYGQLIITNGAPVGGLLPLAHTPAFEGDTQFGGDVAFEPNARRYFSSFGTDSGMGGQESLESGVTVGNQVVLGTGFYTSLNNAADPDTHRFLTAWEGVLGGSYRILGQLVSASIGTPANFNATASNGLNMLAWQNPTDVHFTGTMIRVKTSGYPDSPIDGALVVDRAGAPGAFTNFTHTNLTNWITYYYSAFAHDNGTNYSLAAQALATPRPGAVTVNASDFTAGADGWTLDVWRAGVSGFGTVAWESASGGILSTGSGVSNNRDACTREGSTMTRLISTVGYTSIQVEYDVMAALFAPPGGSPMGSCALLEGTLEDKLVVYFSTAGTNGPWSVAQILREGVELPTTWTRRLINLAGVAGVSNNPTFALRFQWQFNSGSDTGRVDNVRVLSGAVIAPAPAIATFPTAIEHTFPAGTSVASDVLKVSNTGEGILNFNASDDAAWLTLAPPAASSSGPERELAINYSTASLTVGDYAGTIQITSANAVNSPQAIPVLLHVIPPACLWEPFDYYDGNLTTMASAVWSGSAGEPIAIEDGALKLMGGTGTVEARRTISCAGSNGVIVAEIKIRGGTGTGDFFWSIYLDDAASNNLARWYGGSRIARGRVGGLITPDMTLSGPDVWDDLYVEIDTAANISEFFFNGVSFGAISHGAVPGTTVGGIRIERNDRPTAASDALLFENFTIGARDTSSPRLDFLRTGNQLRLSWPATGRAASLESAAGLSTPIVWNPVTNSLTSTNGRLFHTTTTVVSNRFFRLRR